MQWFPAFSCIKPNQTHARKEHVNPPCYFLKCMTLGWIETVPVTSRCFWKSVWYLLMSELFLLCCRSSHSAWIWPEFLSETCADLGTHCRLLVFVTQPPAQMITFWRSTLPQMIISQMKYIGKFRETFVLPEWKE